MFHQLGKMHAGISWGHDSILKKPLATDLLKRLRKIYRQLQSNRYDGNRPALAIELFLDNYHVLSDAAKVCQDFLVEGLYERLPQTVGDKYAGLPRVVLLACELINASKLQLDQQMLRGALSEYQEHAPLSVAEIWALPIILRLIILSDCLDSLVKLLFGRSPKHRYVLLGCIRHEMEEETIISRSVNTLRLLGNIDWREFFDAVSKLEVQLAKDPAGIYADMDFPTRDRYRKVIEEMAWKLGSSEIDIAAHVLSTADRASDHDTRRRHIGYHLVDRGKIELERSLGFRPGRPERLRRLIRKHATVLYLSCFTLAVGLFMLPPLALLAGDETPAVTRYLLAFLALVPACSLGTELLHWLVTRTFRPERLPRMDFSKGIKDGARTIVAVPAMLDNLDMTTQLIRDLEVRYLSNPDPNLSFALLTDFTDAAEMETPRDQQLLKLAEEGIKNLNDRYAGTQHDRFYLLHRERLWSEGEKTWKGWERKRGKIVEFNRWLLGDENTSFKWHFGRTGELKGARFVITLDADTKMPKGAAQALASIMAHPLNTAEFDPQNHRVVAGYTVVQPRVEIDPASEEISMFTRIVSGDIGLDPYSHAVSDAYQDLFGTGIYVGKGIYDVETFTASLAHTVPPCRVLSHDLL
ncbi:MAG: hypothetical protein MUP31_05725, partial [Xanthomonadales bacterium]|nr:hypothetical protein [Xanthomonadales bacterium]